MIKKFVIALFCVSQFSLSYATELKNTLPIPPTVDTHYQKMPKTVIIKTKKFKIRVDLQPNGQYLYQSWGANSKITSKPSMIIPNGELIPDGSGGNYYYEFTNKGYTYQVWRNYLTNSATKKAYTLLVSDTNGKTIAKEDGQVVKN